MNRFVPFQFHCTDIESVYLTSVYALERKFPLRILFIYLCVVVNDDLPLLARDQPP